MKLDIKKLSRWVAALAFAVFAPLAHANGVNLVKNPGFETGGNLGVGFNFANWTLSAGVFSVGESPGSLVHSGSFSARFPYDELGTTVTQSPNLSLTPSTVYNVEFWLNFVAFDNFSAVLDGQDLIALLAADTPDANGWTKYHGPLTASAASADLIFSWNGTLDPACQSSANGRGDCSIFLDDVSVSAAQVPEPGTLLLVGAALAAGAMVRRKKQS